MNTSTEIPISVTFSRTYEEALKAARAFANRSASWRRFQKWGFLYWTIQIFLVMMLVNYVFKGAFMRFTVNGTFRPDLSTLLAIPCAIPISLLLGWFVYQFLRIRGLNKIASSYEGLPPEYFGPNTVTLEPDGVMIHAPLVQVKYSWKMVDSLRRIEEYLFFCRGENLVLWIPISPLGSRVTEFITAAEEWMQAKDAPEGASRSAG